MEKPRSGPRWLYAPLFAFILFPQLSPSSAAKEFTVRQVTNFFNLDLDEQVTPVGILGDDLLFYGYDNNVGGYYRTNGTVVTPIANPPAAAEPLGNVAHLGEELFFTARGENGRELFALSTSGVREVADLNAGPVDTPIADIHVINGQLVFGAGTPTLGKLHHSNGFEVERFPEPTPPNANGAIQVGGRLLMRGAKVYWTDGLTTGSFDTPQVAPFLDIVKAGDVGYFATVSGQVYRTDGLTATQIAQAPASIVSIFEMNGALHYAAYSRSPKTDLSFFRIDGDSATRLLDWTVPEGMNPTDSPFDKQPVLVAGDSAYFSYTHEGRYKLFKFDGQSFEVLSDRFLNSFFDDRVVEADGRVFINVPRDVVGTDLYEDVDGELVLRGPGLRHLTSFEGEILATSNITDLFNEVDAVWQLVGDQFEVLSDTPAHRTSFIEFNGKLYFGGQFVRQGRGSTTIQLYEIAAVPEPGALILTMVLACGLVCSRRMWI